MYFDLEFLLLDRNKGWETCPKIRFSLGLKGIVQLLSFPN